MELIEKRIEELNVATYNPRIELRPGMAEYEKLKVSIQTFGNVEPIVWNKRTGNVVGGHQRLSVLKDLGAETTLVSVVDLSDMEEKLLNVALNKIKGDWDKEKLEAILSDFDQSEAFIAGFDPDEIALLQADNSDLEQDLEDWLDDEEDEYYGASWVITLNFSSNYFAKCWAENNGYEGQVREGTGTTVIRVIGEDCL
jgi:ParB-like chromosome segregation protein Spo0J